VSNAAVTLSDPVSGSNIVSGVTDNTGHFTITNTVAGDYNLTVQADGHSTFHSPVQILIGQTNRIVTFLSRRSVTYSWLVLPTGVADKYTFQLLLTFETSVPVPVVTINPPSLDLSTLTNLTNQISLTISNHGLIAAQGLNLRFGGNSSWKITPLVSRLGTLPAMSSLTVPVTVVRLPPVGMLAKAKPLKPGPLDVTSDDCTDIGAGLDWFFACGDDDEFYDTPFFIYDQEPENCAEGGGGGGPGDGSCGNPFVGGPPGPTEPSGCQSCVTECNDNGELLEGIVTASASQICIGGTVSFSVDSVEDTGGTTITTCTTPDGATTDVTPIDAGTPSYTWAITMNGEQFDSGSGPTASVPNAQAGTYVCQFTATVDRQCPPAPITMSSDPVQVSDCNCSVAISGPNQVCNGGSINLSAVGTPSGGSYEWSVVGSAQITSSATDAKITLQGAGNGPASVHLAYHPPVATDSSQRCSADYQVSVTSGSVQITVDGQDQPFAITALPTAKMPLIRAHVNVVGLGPDATGTTTFTWHTTITLLAGDCVGGRDVVWAMDETVVGGDYTPNFNGAIRGGSLLFTVTANLNGCQLTTNSEEVEIYAENPGPSAVQQYAEQLGGDSTLGMILCAETGQQQFTPDGFCPLWNTSGDGGVGIGQITPQKGENPAMYDFLVWDWTANVRQAVQEYYNKEDAAIGFPSRIGRSQSLATLLATYNQTRKQQGKEPLLAIFVPPFTDEQRMRDTIRGFNGFQGSDPDFPGFNELHEYWIKRSPNTGDPSTDLLVVENVDEQSLTGYAVWEEVPVCKRPAAPCAQRNYVNYVLSQSASCSSQARCQDPQCPP
jgi:hypothetical protein